MPTVRKAGAAFHSNKSFVIKNPCRQPPCAGRSRLLFETERMRSLLRLGSWEQPRSLPAPARTHWRKSILDLRARSHQNNICVFGLQSVFPTERRKKTYMEQSNRVMLKQSVAHTRQPRRRRRGGQLGVNINTGSAVIAQRVIMITTCSLGSVSLI